MPTHVPAATGSRHRGACPTGRRNAARSQAAAHCPPSTAQPRGEFLFRPSQPGAALPRRDVLSRGIASVQVLWRKGGEQLGGQGRVLLPQQQRAIPLPGRLLLSTWGRTAHQVPCALLLPSRKCISKQGPAGMRRQQATPTPQHPFTSPPRSAPTQQFLAFVLCLIFLWAFWKQVKKAKNRLTRWRDANDDR